MNKTDWPSFDDATGIDLFSYSCIYEIPMETIRYRPIAHRKFSKDIDLGYLDHDTCRKLYRAGRINDFWDIEIYESEQEITKLIATESPSTLWSK